MKISPELLAAYADNELDPETARRVEAEIAGKPELQADLTAHRALRARLVARFSPIIEQPVPDHLQQAVTGGGEVPNVVDFATAAGKRHRPALPARWGRFAGPAVAASLVLVLVGYSLRLPDDTYARGDLAQALDGQLVATQRADAPVRVLLSFRDKQGQYCRGFTARTQSGLACHDDRGWRLLETFGGTGGSSTEYRQAGSTDMAVMAAIQDMAAEPALDAVQEEQAARRGWRAQQVP